jgi:sugar phosphate isomerase/epimerase
MPQPVFHASIEGAQHGSKSLEQFLDYAKQSGAAGAQPSSYMLQAAKGFRKASDIKNLFEQRGLSLDGISCHCHFWVHTTAWTGSPTIAPFLPPEVAKRSPAKIEEWCQDYIFRLYDLSAELGIKMLPMFWGTAFGWEVASGYPWGFFSTGQYDLIKAGKERFVKMTAPLRKKANSMGIVLAHEIHPGTGAMCADDFNMLVEACDGDKCLGVNADPSHCWEGEDWETRFLKVGPRVYGCHVKNFVIRKNVPLRMAEADWQKRAMQFCDIPSGDLNMVRYVETLIRVGYAKRYCALNKTKTAPLVVEAESAYRDLDATSANGIAYTRDHLCFPVAGGSFEDGMGA